MTDPRRSRPACLARRAVGMVAGAVLVLGVWPLPSPVAAASPVIQTWWTVNNLTVDLPLPPEVVAPGAIPPVTIPNTDVPDGGSEVAGTTDSPTGALTLRYEFAPESDLGPLVLTVAGTVPVAPGTELIACPLTGDGRFATAPSGGPISKLPEHDCTEGIPGVLSEDATKVEFADIATLAGEDHLSVAILPVAGRVVLERALGDSLPVTEPELTPAVPPIRRPAAAPAPAVEAPAPFLGQVRVEPPPPPPEIAAPAPTVPVGEVEEVAQRFVTVFRATPAGQAAGSATAGAALVLLAASEVWRRGRAALDESDPTRGVPAPV